MAHTTPTVQDPLPRGILTQAGGRSLLIDPSQPFARDQDAIAVPPRLVQQHALPEGASVWGPVREGKRGPELAGVERICGLSPADFAARTPFRQLVAIDPCQRFELAASGELGTRIIDLIAPIGKGTRGLIVSPPKAGKTTLLEQIAQGIRLSEPETRILVLLIDERPEEVTYFRRTVQAEVFASSSDRPQREQVALAELMLAHIRTELECGHDVAVLLDSLTRMSRLYNLQSPGRGRTLTGGLDAAALEIPRRFFGLARNVENGGSVTLLATLLVDTGSRMDQAIFEEFKATGNSEIVLDRDLAEARIYPALNLAASGTRREERLYSAGEYARLVKLRRALVQHDNRRALDLMFQLMAKYPTNRALLESIPA